MLGSQKYLRCCAVQCLFGLILTAMPVLAQAPHGTRAPGRWQPPPPPKNWTTSEVTGYTDGVTAAWADLTAGLNPKPQRHGVYKAPPPSVKPDWRYFYRLAFRKGYFVVFAHEHPDETSAVPSEGE